MKPLAIMNHRKGSLQLVETLPGNGKRDLRARQGLAVSQSRAVFRGKIPLHLLATRLTGGQAKAHSVGCHYRSGIVASPPDALLLLARRRNKRCLRVCGIGH